MLQWVHSHLGVHLHVIHHPATTKNYMIFIMEPPSLLMVNLLLVHNSGKNHHNKTQEQ